MTDHPVLIAGVGICGLTAALAFLRRRDNVRVFEQASRLNDIRAGLHPTG